MKESDIRPQALFNRYLELCREDVRTYFADTSCFVATGCPACDSDPSGDTFTKDTFHYARCPVCSTLYVTPRPCKEQIDAYYADSPSTRFWATDFYKETETARREKLFRPKARMVADLASELGLQDASLLDVGAGYGTFAEELISQQAFSSVTALEPSRSLADVCRRKGLRVIEATVEELAVRGEASFDVAVSLELVEHVFSVSQFLSSVGASVRPGGCFIYSTLSGTGWDILTLGEHSKSVSPPHHLNFLNPQAAAIVARRTGWDLVRVFTPGKLDVDIVVNALREYPDIETDAFARCIAASPEAVRNAFQTFLGENNLSSHMWVIMRKV